MCRFLQSIVVASVFLGAVHSNGFVGGEGRAHASEEAADDLIRRALDLRKKGEDQSALPLLQQAFKQSQSARAAGQLGFCHQGLGQWAEAETYLTSALEKTTDAWVHKNRLVIEQSLAVVKSHIARIEVIGDPAGAEVAINGNVAGKLPLAAPVHVANGEIEVEVRAPGYVTKTKSFHVDGGQYQRVVLRIEREASVAALAQPTTKGAATSEPVQTERSADATPGDNTKRSDTPDDGAHAVRLSLKWVAWGAGLVAAGVGVYGVVENQQRVNSFGKGCGLDAQGVARADGPGYTNAQCVSLKSSYESATTVAIVGFVGAAALTAAGFLFWATDPAAPPARESGVASLSCGPGFGSRWEPGFGCGGRF